MLGSGPQSDKECYAELLCRKAEIFALKEDYEGSIGLLEEALVLSCHSRVDTQMRRMFELAEMYESVGRLGHAVELDMKVREG